MTSPPIDLKVVLEAALDAANVDPAWHPLRRWTPPAPEDMARDRFPGIHPSDMGLGCNRALAYATVNAPRDKGRPLSHKDRRCFDGGHAIHAVVQGYLTLAEELGLLDWVENEAPVGPTGNIVGSCDSLVRKDGAGMGVEIKTAGPSTYWGTKDLTRATSAISVPPADHRRQVTAYMIGLGVSWFTFVYWDKATDGWSVIPYALDPAIEAQIRREAEFALDVAERGILPAKVANLNICRRCPFGTICASESRLEVVDRR